MLNATTLFAVGSVVLFIAGLGGGWLLTRTSKKYATPPVQTAIALLVTGIWVAAVAVELLVPAYTVGMMLHGIMGAVVGYLFSEDGITINIGAGD